MWFVGAGALLVLLKLLAVPIVGQWPWWAVLLPFGLAALWWTFADSAGITQRRVMDQENVRAKKRREQQYENLGMRAPRSGGRGEGSRTSRHGSGKQGGDGTR